MAKKPFDILQLWLDKKPKNEKMSIFASFCCEDGYPKTLIIDNISLKDEFVFFKSEFDFDNKNAALCIYMDESGRQIRIEGFAKSSFAKNYTIKVNLIEFWQKGKYRLHDRNVYNLMQNGWEHNILYP